MFRETLLTLLSRMGYTTDSLVNDRAVGVGRSELTPLERKTAARNICVSLLDEGGSLSQTDRRRPHYPWSVLYPLPPRWKQMGH